MADISAAYAMMAAEITKFPEIYPSDMAEKIMFNRRSLMFKAG